MVLLLDKPTDDLEQLLETLLRARGRGGGRSAETLVQRLDVAEGPLDPAKFVAVALCGAQQLILARLHALQALTALNRCLVAAAEREEQFFKLAVMFLQRSRARGARSILSTQREQRILTAVVSILEELKRAFLRRGACAQLTQLPSSRSALAVALL